MRYDTDTALRELVARGALIRQRRERRVTQILTGLSLTCGALLVAMNITLAVIVAYIVHQNRGFEHGEIVTITLAAYTFTAVTMAIINIVKYKFH